MSPNILTIRIARLAAVIAALGLTLTPPATASDDFGGSFGESSSPEASPPAQPAGGGSDGFGGSFGGANPTAPAPVGSDDFGGSFGENPPESAPGAAPEPAAAGGTPEAPPSDNQPGGGSDFGGGSFDDPGAAGGLPGASEPPQDDQQAGAQETQPVQAEQPAQAEPPAQDQAQGQAQDGPQIDPGILAFETRDFGVPPTDQLRSGEFHAPTPTSIPGAKLVSTQNLVNAMNAGQQFLLIDVLGAQYTLPDAYQAPAMAKPGHFRDRTQQQAVQWLDQISGNNRNVPVVVLCSDPYCWLSYNAGLRVLAAGYTDVYWYRGGHQAWNMAGLQMVPSGF